MRFAITRVPGIANLAFGADGFHLVALTGLGQLWLPSMPPSMPLSVLAHGLQPYLGQQGAPQAAGAGAVGGIMRG
jgi:uncharacterized protein (AIM24 family)